MKKHIFIILKIIGFFTLWAAIMVPIGNIDIFKGKSSSSKVLVGIGSIGISNYFNNFVL
ncbi:MAG: hypothetical protein FWE09_05915 [Treponema sp.]|nr:hypothetical protein [Treponema sp.]